MSRLSKQKPKPLTLPAAQRTSFSLSDSGTFTEGDLTISRCGLVISRGSEEDLADRSHQSSRGSIGTAGSSGTGPLESPVTAEALNSPRVHGGFDAAIDDLETIAIIGCGSSGVVRKVRHKFTGDVLALKVIQMNVQDEVRKQINQELRALYDASSKYVIKYHQAFYNAGAITIVMEYMDGGSLLHLISQNGSISEKYLSEIARQVLHGLMYLHKGQRILHRDIKPSNLLINHAGEVKITDFGVSGQLANSVSKCVSWVGTITYMSPERISGGKYGYDSDIWSFGLTLVECALGRFPYPSNQEAQSLERLSFWDLLHYIVENPPPQLPDNFSLDFRDFICKCLQKEPEKRATLIDLLKHPFITKHEHENINIADLIKDSNTAVNMDTTT